MKTRVATNVFMLLFCVVLGSGCATRKLWEEGQFARFREPANPPQLELFEGKEGSKVLVLYDEETDDGELRKRRAFWADLNIQPPDNPARPRFVRAELAVRLHPVPVVAVPMGTGLCAVTNDVREFTVFKESAAVWTYRLPVYEDRSGRMKQIALTPLTIIADITIVGGYAFLLSGWSGTL